MGVEAKDLRIGNLVRLKSKHKDWVIESGYEIDTGCESDDFAPIILTENRIKELGFLENSRDKNDNPIYRKTYNNGHFDLLRILNFYYGDHFICVEIRFVHHLQNLYYAITGEELKPKTD
jgi:hypothetical protein